MNVSAGSTAVSSRSGISTRRGEVSPSPKRTVVVVGLKSRPACAVPPRVDSSTLALPCEPPVRVTSTIGLRWDSLAVKPASLSCSTPAWRGASARALRRLQRPHGRLLELRLAARLEAVGRQQQPGSRCCGSWMNACAAGLAAAIVDRLGLQADVHGEQLADADGRQRDLEGGRGLLRTITPGRAGSAVVGVAVDVELRPRPTAGRGVGRGRRARAPRVLMALEVRDPAGGEEVTARRRRVRAGVEAHDGAHRLAVAVGRALPGREAGCCRRSSAAADPRA